MPRAVPVPLRQLVLQRCQDGQAPTQVAQELGLKPDTVRHLIRRLRVEGPEAIVPRYGRCGATQPTADPVLIAAALELRRQHPHWGAGFLRVRLRPMFPGRTLPCARTLQRHLAQAGLNPAPPGRRDGPHPGRATRPHEVWQLDAADQITLGGGEQVSWVRTVDEASGAVLATEVFPPAVLEQRPPRGDPGVSPPAVYPLGAAPAAAR